MAAKENKEKKPDKKGSQSGEEKVKKERPQDDLKNEILVRIFGYDIPGSRNVFAGLTRIKGVSWSIASATCLGTQIPRTKKVETLTKPEIQKIEEYLRALPIPAYLKNRRSDAETGVTSHYFGVDLDMKREFDIKRLKEIKSYKGIRHAQKLPVRGQRTKSHFRSKKTHAAGRKKK